VPAVPVARVWPGPSFDVPGSRKAAKRKGSVPLCSPAPLNRHGPLMSPPGFAQTYSRGERIRFVLVGAVLGALGLAVWKWWVLPWIAGFPASAPCRTVFGANGATVLWFGLFVALPLLFAALSAIGLGRPGLAVLREGRYPPDGVKVFRPVRIRRGAAARWIGYLHVLACAPFLAIAIWGYGQAVALSHMKGTTPCFSQPDGRQAHSPVAHDGGG
jgi:hypothetical protein